MSLNLGTLLHLKLHILQKGLILLNALWSVGRTGPIETTGVENAHREKVLVMLFIIENYLSLNIDHFSTSTDVIEQLRVTQECNQEAIIAYDVIAGGSLIH